MPIRPFTCSSFSLWYYDRFLLVLPTHQHKKVLAWYDAECMSSRGRQSLISEDKKSLLQEAACLLDLIFLRLYLLYLQFVNCTSPDFKPSVTCSQPWSKYLNIPLLSANGISFCLMSYFHKWKKKSHSRRLIKRIRYNSMSLSLAKAVNFSSSSSSWLLQKCLLYPTLVEISIIYRAKPGKCPMVLMYCSYILYVAIYLNNVSCGSFIHYICTAHYPSAFVDSCLLHL